MSAQLTPYNFTISDQSPIFQYSPSRDGPIASSWNVTYADDSDAAWVADSFIGAGPSSHRTTLVGASVQLDWIGTAIYLYGIANTGGYSIQIDGIQTPDSSNQPGMLFGQSGLSYGAHSLVLRVVNGELSISNATITGGMGDIGTTVQNRTIQTTSIPITTNGIVLSGSEWATQPYTYANTNTPNPRIGTPHQGDSISFPLTSTSTFYITGSVNYNHGTYTVTVTPPPDFSPQQPNVFNGSSRWIGLNEILYLGTGMNRSETYQVEVTNDTPSLWFDMNAIVIFDTPPSPSSSPSAPPSSNGSITSSSSPSLGTGAIVGVAIGSTFVALAILVLLLGWGRKRREKRLIATYPTHFVAPTYPSQPFPPIPVTAPMTHSNLAYTPVVSPPLSASDDTEWTPASLTDSANAKANLQSREGLDHRPPSYDVSMAEASFSDVGNRLSYMS